MEHKVILVPAAPGTCPVCAVEHDTRNPHNKDSLYYQYRFFGLYGRWPTWADALAHCSTEVREAWKSGLIAKNAWSEPESGEPLADSCNQPIVTEVSKVFKVTKHPLEQINESLC
jgi:hypothetical protein